MFDLEISCFKTLVVCGQNLFLVWWCALLVNFHTRNAIPFKFGIYFLCRFMFNN